MEAPLLGNDDGAVKEERKIVGTVLWVSIALISFTGIGLVFGGSSGYTLARNENKYHQGTKYNSRDIIESERGVVAADDGRCSEIGASMLRKGGHAIDAAVATAVCLGVINPSSSGLGGGGFMILWSSATSKAQAFNMREAAPLAASQNMYADDPQAKYSGALSTGIPGELAGLYEAWLRHGRLSWRTLFQPAINLAKDGFSLTAYLGKRNAEKEALIMADRGLREVFAPGGRLLKAGDTCYNVKLGQSLEAIAEKGPQAFYNGTVGENFIRDVRDAGGILTMEDLRSYRAEVTDAMAIDVMGHTILGMPPPSSGTLGLSLVLNILDSYGSPDAAKGSLGLHRLLEALKHMFAVRMNLGDPQFVDSSKYIADMLSPTFARQLQQKIFDNTTFPPEYYMNRWSQLRDHGTSHFCIVDAERNAVSMTTTVNSPYGARILSPSTGIVLNNEMDDFSTPTELHPDALPPAPANFIEPQKQPLSSMTPLIVLKDGQLSGVLGVSGGIKIIPVVAQVFLDHYIFGMEPLAAVQKPRVYHKLIPNVVQYENWTVFDGEHIELQEESKRFLRERGHQLEPLGAGSICQLVVQTLQKPIDMGRKTGRILQSYKGVLTAVSDPRKGGIPAAI